MKKLNLMKVRRHEKGLTLMGLAVKVGSSETHISAVENGRVRPNPDLVDRIAGALGVDPEHLFDPVRLMGHEHPEGRLLVDAEK